MAISPRLILAVLLLVHPLVSTASAETPVDDKELAKRIIGTWKFEESTTGISIVGTTRYIADGTWKSEGSMSLLGEKHSIVTEGKWSLSGKNLAPEVTKTNDPDFLKVGEKWVETIISISDKEFRYLDEDRVEKVEKRAD